MKKEQNLENSTEQALNIPVVKPSYSLEEQKKRICFSLGLSSRTFHYPSQYDDIVEWMMRCPLVV